MRKVTLEELEQMAAMVDYLSVLEVRAYDEGIDLWG